MRDRLGRLLLSVLLLKAEYADSDFDSLKRALDEDEPEFRSLFRMLERVGHVKAQKPKRGRVNQLTNPKDARDALIQSLKIVRSEAARKRLASVAKRLGVENLRREDRLIVEEISVQLFKMSDPELAAFLKPYRLNAKTDEGYLGLANFLIRKDE